MNFSSVSITLDRLSLLHRALPGIALLALGMASGQPVLAEPTPQNVNRELLSITNLGDQIEKSSSYPSISEWGQRIAFVSSDPNVVLGADNHRRHIYVRDRENNTTVLVSRGPEGPGDDHSYSPSISLDGRFVAYASSASNLVCKPACDKNGTLDIYLYDLDKRINTRISQGIKGESNGPSYTPSVSGDGNRVVFVSMASNLVDQDPNGEVPDVFLWDRFTGIKRIPPAAFAGRTMLDSHSPRISGDGRFIVFVTEEDTGDSHIMLHVIDPSLQSEGTYVISLFTELTRIGRNLEPSISEFGDFIAWVSNGYLGREGLEKAPFRIVVKQTSLTLAPFPDPLDAPVWLLNREPGEQRQPQIFGIDYFGQIDTPFLSDYPRFGVAYTSILKDKQKRDIVIQVKDFMYEFSDYIYTVSTSPLGAESNGPSGYPTAWGDHLNLNWFVAFQTEATNLVVDENEASDVVLISYPE
ncbi:MAG: hypothetical protein WBQ37_14560 [Candidatus Competibacter sp.]